MKRIFALLLSLCLLLCACGTPEETVPTTVETTPTTVETEPTTEATTEATEATEPPVLYRHPLTGAPLEEPFTGRATAVVINNIQACLPQYGISEADMIYELETEGGITRMLALYTDLTDVGTIGPVRSARTYFNSVALSYNAPLIHCGGSVAALKAQIDAAGNSISNWEHIDQRFNGGYFFRDSTRSSQGYAYEHTLFTSGGQLTEALAAKGFNTVSEGSTDYGLQFADEISLNGETANTVTVKFRYNKTTTMTYNAETGLYEASQYNSEHIDAGTGNVMSYRNVLVLYATQTSRTEGSYTRSYYELVGSGSGHFACNGQIIPIKWSRDAARGCFTYTLEDGTPLTLGVGTSYVGIVSNKMTASYE